MRRKARPPVRRLARRTPRAGQGPLAQDYTVIFEDADVATFHRVRDFRRLAMNLRQDIDAWYVTRFPGDRHHATQSFSQGG